LADHVKNLLFGPVRLLFAVSLPTGVYRASDEREHREWLEELEVAADRLGLGTDARSRAADVFLSSVPDEDRSKRATLAASLYVGALVAGEQRSQASVAEAAGVSRLTVQQRWKELLEAAGLDPPGW
jgi:transcription initiation factor TFIIIB Brf1 subunit/transcription initiation factor TFIIB